MEMKLAKIVGAHAQWHAKSATNAILAVTANLASAMMGPA
jgi:hypothetical protein